MRKNKAMRAAGGMLIATLLSTSIVSGTYAKYVTEDSGSDTARVAKFGVVVTADGDLFSDTYKTTANTPGVSADNKADAASLSVVSAAYASGNGVDGTDHVVAPGTKNTDGLTFTVTGTPEVAVKLAFDVKDDAGADFEQTAKDIYLKAKTGLPDMTTGNATDTFDNAADYYPVQYTLTSTGTAGISKTGTLKEVTDYLNGLTTLTYPANTDLSAAIGTLKLTWEWEYGAAETDTGHDKQDTLLGDLAAGTTLTPAATLTAGTDYNLNTGVKITLSVTQVD